MNVGPNTGPRASLVDRAGSYTEQVLQALDGIQYGSVEIVIHNAQIVQIVRTERVRFDCDPRPRGS